MDRRRFIKLLGATPLIVRTAAGELVRAEPGESPQPAKPKKRPRQSRPPRREKGRIRPENGRAGSATWTSSTLRRSRGPREIANRSGAAAALDRPGAGGQQNASFRVTAPGRDHPLAAAALAADPVDAWQDTVIRGYPARTSVAAGEALDLFIGTTANLYDIDIYRMGYYGGAGARLMGSARGLHGQNQSVPQPNATFGTVECNWTASYTVRTAADWVSGVYLAKLSASTGQVGYVPFVVRDDTRASDLLYVLPVTTYQAYNNWGGKSLYDFNSTAEEPAVKVSFDRPYAGWAGAGSFFDGDYNFIRWLESQGYDVSYATSIDLQENAGLLNAHKIFLSPWHDEYYSAGMRAAVTNFRDSGKHLAYAGANSVYWQIRFEPSSSGNPNRVVVGYKDTRTDPMQATNPSLTTGLWRDAPVSQPESALLGSMYESHFVFGTTFPWVATNVGHWAYDGTALAEGAPIDGLVGYEYDRAWSQFPLPAGLEVLSASPVTDVDGVAGLHQASLYQHTSGGLVFNAGTVGWSWKLDDNAFQHHGADSRVQRITRNVLAAMINEAPPRPETVPELSLTVFDEALAPGWENWSWNSQVNFAVGSPVFQGGVALSFDVTAPWGALYLRSATPVDTAAYSHLSFAARASVAGQRIAVWLVDAEGGLVGNAVTLTNYGGDPDPGVWRYYNVPLDADNLAANGRAISGIIIQDDTNATQPAMFLDSVGFSVPGVPAPAPDVVVTVAESSLGVNAGASASYHVTISSTGGFDSSVTVAVTGLPAGVTASPVPQRVVPTTGGVAVEVVIQAATTAAAATSNLVITARGGGLARSVTTQLVVAAGAAGPALPVFTDALASGWTDWSWNSTVNLSVTSPVYEGNRSLSFDALSAWGGLYLRTANPVNTAAYSHLTFAAQGTQAGQRLAVWLVDANGAALGTYALLSNYGGDPEPGTWRRYDIPLGATGFGANGAPVGGIVIQDNTGQAQPVVYLDRLGFEQS